MSNLKIPTFLEALGDDTKTLETVCADEMKYLREVYTTGNSLKTALTTYRNALRDIVDDHVALGYMKLSKDESLKLKLEYNKLISDRQRNIRAIDNVDEYLLFAESLLASTSYVTQLLGLAALTGRRTSELLCTAEFEPIDDFSVMFKGQLKSKGRGDVKPYPIPLLAPASVVIPALERLQSGRPELKGNPTLAKNRTGKPISQKMKKLFPKFLGDNPQGRDLRRAYGAIAFHMSDRENEITKQKFISDVLGHGVDDNLTGGSYMDFIVVDTK